VGAMKRKAILDFIFPQILKISRVFHKSPLLLFSFFSLFLVGVEITYNDELRRNKDIILFSYSPPRALSDLGEWNAQYWIFIFPP